MTRLVLVRHGESTGNKLRRFYGHFDGELTELGKMQADRAGEYLKDYKFDKAYASDLKRAYETGCRIAAYHEGLEVIPDENLREIYAGEWENALFASLETDYAEEYQKWKFDLWNARPTKGESVQELARRVSAELWRIAEENDGKTVLIATHATPIRSQICSWKNLPNSRVAEIAWVKNASVTIVDYDVKEHKASIVMLGETSFISDIETALPANV